DSALACTPEAEPAPRRNKMRFASQLGSFDFYILQDAGQRWTRASDAQEDLAPVHPEKHQPIRQQDGDPLQERLQPTTEKTEEMGTQVNMEGTHDEFLEKVGHQIGGDGIHSDDDQRERPFTPAFHLNNPAEGGQQQETSASAKQGPARGPDA